MCEGLAKEVNGLWIAGRRHELGSSCLGDKEEAT